MSLRAEAFVSLIGAMETAINAYLALDPLVQKKLAALQGRVIAIELESAPANPLLTLYMLPGENGIELLTQYAGEADTTLSGTPVALAKMSLAKKFEAVNLDCPDASEVLFSGDVVIRGDVELGQRFRHILDEMDIDWEEHLSHLSGDIIAHKAGKLVREVGQWWQQALSTLADDASEFMQQESELLPEATEVSQFMNEVDVLRSDLDRLEARIRQLS
ncbi:MAG: sterol-binding protein [Gammaproteobacteria bacterium]|nr:sterol-binding protein [Gammaproteobacteria bacterium]